jgi:hypothetical protein
MLEKPQSMALFCDEAGKDTDRFLAVGGLIVSHDNATYLRQFFSKLKSELSLSTEVKWNKLDRGNKTKFQQIIHRSFYMIEQNRMQFHCILIDFDRFNHNLRKDGGKGESIKRMYYQLILHRLGKLHGESHRLFVFPDKCNELKGLTELKSALNIDIERKFGFRPGPLKAIELRDSQDEIFLQINDLILGAICYQKNKRYSDKSAGQAKANLAGDVLGLSALEHLDQNTPLTAKNFTVWNLQSAHLKGSTNLA